MSTDYIDGVRAKDVLGAPSAISRDVLHTTNPEAFARQMACFDSMRQTEQDFRAGKFDWKEFRGASLQGRAGALPASPKLEAPQDASHQPWCTAWAPCHDTTYPRGVIDLRRLTGRDLPSIEPGRNWK